MLARDRSWLGGDVEVARKAACGVGVIAPGPQLGVATALLLASLAGAGCERTRVPREQARDAMGPAGDALDGGRAADIARESEPPGVRCVDDPVAFPIRFDAIDAIDVLFVIDDSPTMAPVQEQLTFLFPQLLSSLTSVVTDSRVESVHLGVASGDLGLLGVEGVEGCGGLGKDAQLRHDPPPGIDCARTLPTFLSFTPARDDPFASNAELACMVELGTTGCGLQQPLEVALKALWPSHDARVLIGGGEQRGHGDTSNAGFLRDPALERSVLALVLVTNKDDCSLIDPAAFAAGAGLDAHEGAELVVQLNARCGQDPSRLHDPARYLEAFELLRGSPDRLLVFAAIAGMPRTTRLRLAAAEADDAEALETFYDALLAEPAMQVRSDDHGTLATHDDTLGPACEGSHGSAWPSRRLVEVARELGPRAVVGSICEDDFGDTVRALAVRAHRLLGDPCLATTLQRGDDGLVACELIWTLPGTASQSLGSPASCDAAGLPFLRLATPERSADGRVRCRVPQLRVASHEGGLAAIATANAGETVEHGWYYDDFSGETQRQCPQLPRRVALSEGVEPPAPDVRVELECTSAALGRPANMGCELLPMRTPPRPQPPSEGP